VDGDNIVGMGTKWCGWGGDWYKIFYHVIPYQVAPVSTGQ